MEDDQARSQLDKGGSDKSLEPEQEAARLLEYDP